MSEVDVEMDSDDQEFDDDFDYYNTGGSEKTTLGRAKICNMPSRRQVVLSRNRISGEKVC